MIVRPRLAGVQALATAVVLVVGCVWAAIGHGDGGRGVPVASGQVLRLVQQAPQRIADAASVRLDMTMRISGSGGSATVESLLQLDPQRHVATGTVSLPDGTREQLVQSRHTLYAAIHPDQVPVYQGKHWVSLHVTKVESPTAGATTGLGYLELLAGADGTILSYGREVVDGVPTTHYRVTVSVAAALEHVPQELRTVTPEQASTFGVDSLPVDVWLDRQGVPRRLSIDLSVQGISFSLHVTVSPSDQALHVQIPAPGDTYRASSIQEWQAVATGQN